MFTAWTDTTTIPQNQNALFMYEDYFNVDINAVYNSMTRTVRLTGSISPKYDFTGELSSDSFEIRISYRWLSDEQFMGEYVNDEVVGYVGKREIYLEKANNYTINLNIVVHVANNNGYFESPRCSAQIDYIFDEPTIQIKHN